MSRPAPAILPLGESALTIAIGDRVDPGLNAWTRAIRDAIDRASLPGVREVIAAYATVTVFYDPLAADTGHLASALGEIARGVEPPPAAAPTRLHRVPVRYDGQDLEAVAGRTGLSVQEVIARHAERTYTVYCLGFVPGFAYLGELDAALALPRREAPRRRVPAGSVAIAGRQTGVYPYETPGGWHLLGHTDLVAFDPAREPPALFAPGDAVRFEPVA